MAKTVMAERFVVESIDARQVDPVTAAFLHDHLTLGSGGEMAAVFRTVRNSNRAGWSGRAVIVRDGDEIVGWGLRWKAFSDATQWVLHVFVAPGRRRQGIGTTICAEASKRLSRPLKGMVWDDVSAAFYGSGKAAGFVVFDLRRRRTAA